MREYVNSNRKKSRKRTHFYKEMDKREDKKGKKVILVYVVDKL